MAVWNSCWTEHVAEKYFSVHCSCCFLLYCQMLEELSPDWQKGQSVNQSWMRHDGGCTSTDCHRSSDNTPSTSISHITLQGVPVALRNPPPISKYHHDNSNHSEYFCSHLLCQSWSSMAAANFTLKQVVI